MKEEIDITEAREIWNSPSPQMDKDQIDRAYESIGSYILRSRISKGIKACIGGVAAACLVIAGIFIGRIEKPEMVAEEYVPEYVEYMAVNGDIKEVLLADGTHVYLNAQSRLNCEKSLTGATRDVFLCGEAFFEVAKDTLHPFIVHAAGTQIKVTGTKFNVRAFPDEDNSTTTLVEGGVEVRISGQANPITLVPGTALSVSNKNLSASLFEVDAVNATGWYKGEFNAYHMTLEQICHNLERRFGVKIFIANQNVASKLFYASFVNNEDVEGILKSLNVNKDFRVKKQEGNLYTIY